MSFILHILLTIVFALALISFFILFLSFMSMSIGIYGIFRKSKRKGWYAFVPVFNLYKLCEMAHCTDYFTWLAIICFWGITIINIISDSATGSSESIASLLGFALFMIIIFIIFEINKRVANCFGYDSVIWYLFMTIFPLIAYLILGFNSSRYTEPYDEAYLFKK